jgi:Zn-dependent protease
MRDPLSWALPFGRLFGVSIRLHVLFIVLATGLLLRSAFRDQAPPGEWLDALAVIGILFFSVLSHELGHCFAARLAEGEAREIVIWPLGGLTTPELPHSPRPHFFAAAAGPFVNFALCASSGLAFLLATHFELWLPVGFGWNPYRVDAEGAVRFFTTWSDVVTRSEAGVILFARVFYVNWILLLVNLLPAPPLDGGRLLQAMLWPTFGFRQASQQTVYIGFVVMLAVAVVALAAWNPLFLVLAWFIWATCKNQLILLETSGEDSPWGYDFSQGYTSLEREAPPRRRRPNFFQRWLNRRAAQKLQREQERHEAEERRLDELLEKVQRTGLASLSDEERAFMKRVSDRYKNRREI